MAFDYKKEYKEFYLPAKKPAIITIPSMNFVAVDGHGNPNDPAGEYQAAMQLLYGIAFTIKMSLKANWRIEGFFEYVVPPLEGLWHINSSDGIFDYQNKDALEWKSMIRLQDFVTKEIFEEAASIAGKKKKTDFSKAAYFTYNEGLCVQCMHIGPYDNEPETIAAMKTCAEKSGLKCDYGERLHHEIYESDPRRCNPEKLKTVIRIPIKKSEQ